MNNLPLQPLVWDWSYGDGGKTNAVCRAKSPSHEYIIRLEAGGDCYVDYRKFDNDEDSDNRKDEPPVFDSIKAAQEWAQSTHYPSKMQPYVKPDSITDIRNWFKAAKPEPTIDDLCVQIGCHLEEVAELLEALGLKDYDTHEQLTIDADHFKNKSKWALMKLTKLNYEQRIAIVDACCDTNVTGTGIMQLLGGVDVLGAQREVIRSNNSKMVDGKFIFDDNGKITKPDSYSEPDLTPFIKQGE